MEYAGKIVISITDPILVNHSGSSFVTYKLTGVDQKGAFENKRRYRDFFLLREKLVERWPGLYIPPISSKKATVYCWIFRGTQRRGLFVLGKNSWIISVKK